MFLDMKAGKDWGVASARWLLAGLMKSLNRIPSKEYDTLGPPPTGSAKFKASCLAIFSLHWD